MEFNFCPRCGSELGRESYHDQSVARCQNEACRFIFWQNAKPAAAAVISNSEGFVLMTTRGVNPDKGKLDLPGGILEEHELPEEGLKREVKEEVGITIEIDGLLGFALDPYEYQGVTQTVLAAGFAATTTGEPLAADAREVTQITWIDPATIDPKDLAFTSNEKFLRLWQERRR